MLRDCNPLPTLPYNGQYRCVQFNLNFQKLKQIDASKRFNVENVFFCLNTHHFNGILIFNCLIRKKNVYYVQRNGKRELYHPKMQEKSWVSLETKRFNRTI